MMIPLWEKDIPYFDESKRQFPPSLSPFLLPGKNNPACIVIPGGGYAKKAWDHEGIQIAEWLNKIGISAFLLDYRVSPEYDGRAYLADGKRALTLVRENWEKYGIDPNRLGICGFSAGGHLAGSCATMYENKEERPDFALLCYAVLTLGEGTHQGTSDNFLGHRKGDEEYTKQSSPVFRVTSDCPPMFLWTTAGDKTVPPYPNTFAMADALKANGVPYRLEFYDHGVHGLGIPKNDPEIASWILACEEWLKEIHVI